jgi:DNA primase
LELLARTTAYYERQLWESKEAHDAREYLTARGLGEEVLRSFRVGYAPSAWDRVLLASRRAGFSEQELYATGLAQRSAENGRLYDRFRARIMFPLADVRGRVLGFGARALREGQRPKYLNTSDNDIYHKGLHLYGGDLARAHATRAGEVVLCEGYTDVIALHQAGMRNAVGLMGTALTAEQVGELSRMAARVLMALDADSAGQEAMLRAAKLASSRKLELRVVPLPAGTDPAELVQSEGVGAVQAAVEQSLPFVRFRVERTLAQGDYGSPEGRDRTIEELRPIFATLPPSAMRMELMRLVSGRLELPESLLEQELLAPPVRAQSSRPIARVLSRREETERTFLVLCLASPKAGAVALRNLDLDRHFTSDLLRAAAQRLRDGDLHEPMRSVQGGAGDGSEGGDVEGILAELVVQAGREPGQPAMLEVQRLQLELASVDRQIQAARTQGAGDVTGLARRRGDVKREFDLAYERALAETML